MTRTAKKKAIGTKTKTQGTVKLKVTKVKKGAKSKSPALKSKDIKKTATTKTKTVSKVKTKTKKTSIFRNKQTRLEILQTLAENTGLPKVQVEKFFFELVKLIEGHLNPKGSGEFSIPFTGIKIKRVKKKASKSRTMFSPLIGEEVKIAGKSARNIVKILALKTLKDMVEK